jgi:hypothetical protein
MRYFTPVAERLAPINWEESFDYRPRRRKFYPSGEVGAGDTAADVVRKPQNDRGRDQKLPWRLFATRR